VLGPQVEAWQQVAGLAGGEVDQQQGDLRGVLGGAMPDPLADHPAPVGGAGHGLDRPVGVVQQHAPLARGHVDRHQLGARVAHVPVDLPAAHHRAAVRGDREVDLVERPPGRGRQVAAVLEAALPVRGRGGEQPRLPRAEVVVPVADRVALEQLGGDPGVLAALLLARVGLQVLRADVHAGPVHHRAGVAAAGGRQQPQRRHLLGVVVAGGLLGVAAGGGEQQRAVGQERRVRLAGR
jgi:hypothetical protein